MTYEYLELTVLDTGFLLSLFGKAGLNSSMKLIMWWAQSNPAWWGMLGLCECGFFSLGGLVGGPFPQDVLGFWEGVHPNKPAPLVLWAYLGDSLEIGKGMFGPVYPWLHLYLLQETHVVLLKCCEMWEKSNLWVYFPFGAWGNNAAAFKGFGALEKAGGECWWASWLSPFPCICPVLESGTCPGAGVGCSCGYHPYVWCLPCKLHQS